MTPIDHQASQPRSLAHLLQRAATVGAAVLVSDAYIARATRCHLLYLPGLERPYVTKRLTEALAILDLHGINALYISEPEDDTTDRGPYFAALIHHPPLLTED